MIQNTSNHDNSTVTYKITAGSEDKTWTVNLLNPSEANVECIVEYPEQEKSQVVTLDRLDKNHECTGTHFEYRGSCCHVTAAELALSKYKGEHENRIGRNDAVLCEICGKAHAGNCGGMR